MACFDEMLALITGKYLAEYTAFKGGNNPDGGDAMWLCDNGIDTEKKLLARLGISGKKKDDDTLALAIVFVVVVILVLLYAFSKKK